MRGWTYVAAMAAGAAAGALMTVATGARAAQTLNITQTAAGNNQDTMLIAQASGGGAKQVVTTTLTRNFNTFNVNQGVLMSVGVKNPSVATVSAELSGEFFSLTTATASFATAFSAPGLAVTATANATSFCGVGDSFGMCTESLQTGGANLNVNQTLVTSLASYATGAAGLSGSTVSTTEALTLTANPPSGRGGTNFTSGELDQVGFNLTYNYLLHAAPSFSPTEQDGALILNFGTVDQGAAAADQVGAIYNLGDLNTIGLDLLSVTPIGAGGGPFGLDLPTFANLAGDASQAFSASLDTSHLGDFAQSYLLTLSDDTSGGGVGQRTFGMEITLVGDVVDPPAVINAGVPEPAEWALLVGGFGLAGAALRARRRAIA